MSEPPPIFDIVIAGAGVSGLALAAAVKNAIGGGVSIALVDPAPPPAARRAAAAHGCDRRRAAPPARAHRRLAGDRTERASDPHDGRSWTGQERDAVRPHPPQFRSQKRRSARPYGVQRRCRPARLAALCDRLEVQRLKASVVHWSPGKRVAELGLSDGRSLRARLGVAADGARSKLGALAGHRDRRLGLRSDRHRRHHRPRARSRRPRRAAFPARRPVRDPAASGPPVEHRLERAARRRPRAP